MLILDTPLGGGTCLQCPLMATPVCTTYGFAVGICYTACCATNSEQTDQDFSAWGLNSISWREWNNLPVEIQQQNIICEHSNFLSH